MATAIETRFFELRATDDREITGIVVEYGAVATLPWCREKIEAGAFGSSVGGDLILNAHHDRSQPLCRTGPTGGLEMLDSPTALRMRARLPKTRLGDDVAILIRDGVLRALSVEMMVTDERLADSDLRIIEGAELRGVAVVDRPAYPTSVIDARAAAIAAMRRPLQPVRRWWL